MGQLAETAGGAADDALVKDAVKFASDLEAHVGQIKSVHSKLGLPVPAITGPATCRSFSLVPIGKGIFGGARRAMPTVQPEERPTVRPPLHLAAQLAAQLPEQLAAQLVEELVVRYSTADRNKPAARRAQPAVQLAAQLAS